MVTVRTRLPEAKSFHADLEIQFAGQTPQYKGWLSIGTELGDGHCVCFTVARQLLCWGCLGRPLGQRTPAPV